nr:RNA-directed DNA polymerase, eukaryota [Tanacetum cinerariifolium]
MGSHRSMEDDVAKISITVYVTNFPESITAKALFHSCKVYGHVVDSFIPNKRAKNGKRFAFVRFINVFSEERLVNNLCTVWIDRHKLHANISRFHRKSEKGVKVENKGDNSYVKALKGERLTCDDTAAIVLDDGCLSTRDLSNAILGRVKEFASLANLKIALNNEGFVDMKIRYMGEFWVMMEFANKEVIKKFRDNVSVGSWFLKVTDASLDFQPDKRIAWVETEGIPFNLWTDNTFNRIADKWGFLLDVDDQEDSCFHSKRLYIHTKVERSISGEFKIIHRGKIYWIRANETPGWVPDFNDETEDEELEDVNFIEDVDKDQGNNHFGDDEDIEGEQENSFGEGENGIDKLEEGEVKEKVEVSEDPFNIYSILNKKCEKDGSGKKSVDSLRYPPGFSPKECKEENYVNVGAFSHANEADIAPDMSKKDEGNVTSFINHLNTKDDLADYVSSGHFKKSEVPRIGGSILGLLDEVETKMETMDLFSVKRCWGNLSFDCVHSEAVRNLGGILCVWDPNSFHKENSMISDSFVMVHGVWCPTGQKFMLIAVYAPHDSRAKHILWDYLQNEILKWKGEVVVMGDFNEVRFKSDHFGSVFNAHEANVFNWFITNSNLVEVNLGGCSYTWCHKSATKMSKLDTFLISDSLMNSCPNINVISLERLHSDHRPILLRESHLDYGPIRLKSFTIGSIWMVLIKRWRMLGRSTRMDFPKQISKEEKQEIKCEVTNEEIKRAVWECGSDKAPGPDGFTFGFFRRFWDLIKSDVFDAVRYFFEHSEIPKRCNSSFIALIPKNQNASLVKDFRPICLVGNLYKIIAKILANRLVGVLNGIVNEVQSAFISDRQILDGPFILNEVLQWCKSKHKQALIFKVDFEKAYDSVKWDFFDDVLNKFGFGNKWCKWIQCCLRSSRGSILVNGSPTEEFQFGKGLKQGDPLSPFLFILVMESLHISFQRIVDAGRFHGIKMGGGSVNISHMFYVDDAVFIGQWCESNITTIVHVLKCFHKASGLRINMCKSKIMGVHVDGDMVKNAAKKLGCLVLKTPFSYLGSIVGGSMHRRQSWIDIVDKVKKRLSKWKLQSLFIGGRLTLVKAVLEGFYLNGYGNFVPKETLYGLELSRLSTVLTGVWELIQWFNISRRGIPIDSILCVNCDKGVETSRHLFFSCRMAKEVTNLIARWRDVPEPE